MSLFVILVPALLASGCDEPEIVQEEPVRPVRAMKVADFAGVTERSFPGRAAATQEINAAFRISGQLIKRPIKVGEDIKKGDLIAALDPSTFQAEVTRSNADMVSSQAAHERAVLELDRQKELLANGWVTQARVDTVQATESAARASVIAAAAALERAELDLSFTALTAPFDGVVVDTYVENFQEVLAKQPIARIVDTSQIEFDIDIPEGLISMVPYVQDMRVRFDAFPDLEVPAKVEEIGTEASQTTRTYRVTLIMDQPEGVRILPGMVGTVTGSAAPPSEERPLNIVVPTAAVFASKQSNESSVWVIDESSNTVNRRPVQIGNLISGGYVIDAGLEPGEIIATAGANFLREGQKVRPEVR
ncbi:MAG: efflux RND transporter periplasmic adaptor subunit [Alphaproteobacteria bacterium]|nr:efflux RND transporter periplasmic adaptor subunit [Alphaproteobacteria bacterium]